MASDAETGKGASEGTGEGAGDGAGATPLSDWTPPPAPGRMVLEGAYLRLEPLTLAHADALHAANDEAERWHYLPYGPFELDAYRDWVREISRHADPLFFAFVTAEGPVGIGSLMRIAPAAGTIEIGHLNFSRHLAGRPAATEGIFMMADWAFAAGYRRLEWKCDAANRASRRAAQRFGFSYEGIFRQAAVVKGRNRDTAWFAMMDWEWPQLRQAFTSWLAAPNFDVNGRQRQRLSALTAPVLAARDPLLEHDA
ncbi:MAG: GNAT family protein [Pseudomonadota bacterium]